jgi:diamine N-acetyltransferase
MRIQGKQVLLRPPESGDDAYILMCENNRAHWIFSQRSEEITAEDLREFRKNQGDFHSDGQLRLLVTNHEGVRVGIADLFAYDAKQQMAEVGILIYPELYRRNGLASESIRLITDLAFDVLGVKEIRARVQTDNQASQQLFRQLGFFPVPSSDTLTCWSLRACL